jgi:hypothetical protein
MKVIFFSAIAMLFLAGCVTPLSPEHKRRMAESNKPRVISINEFSVTVSQYGNSMLGKRPSAETVALANQSCKSVGKKQASWASFSDPDKASAFDPEFMRNHHLFMCL